VTAGGLPPLVREGTGAGHGAITEGADAFNGISEQHHDGLLHGRLAILQQQIGFLAPRIVDDGGP
jgi:hypothetical protein